MPTLLLVGLISGVALAQIFSNQLSYNIRVKGDDEFYTITEVSSSFNDIWGSGRVSVKVFIEEHHAKGTPKLYAEIVNLDGNNISISDIGALRAMDDGNGDPYKPMVAVGLDSFSDIIQGGNSSSVIVWQTILFGAVDTPTTFYIEYLIDFLPGIVPGEYAITLYVY